MENKKLLVRFNNKVFDLYKINVNKLRFCDHCKKIISYNDGDLFYHSLNYCNKEDEEKGILNTSLLCKDCHAKAIEDRNKQWELAEEKTLSNNNYEKQELTEEECKTYFNELPLIEKIYLFFIGSLTPTDPISIFNRKQQKGKLWWLILIISLFMLIMNGGFICAVILWAVYIGYLVLNV